MQNANGSIGGTPPPLMPPQSAPIFREGITLTLSRWSALQMAVENEWGGRGSRAMADQLVSDIFAWFTQSREPLYIDDLEDMLDEAMLSLNTMAQDGSVEEVAEKLMVMHEECLEGNYQSIVTLRETHTQSRAHVRQVANDDDDDSSDDDDDSSNMMTDTPESLRPARTPTNESRPREPTVTEDGWTVVPSRRRGRQN